MLRAAGRGAAPRAGVMALPPGALFPWKVRMTSLCWATRVFPLPLACPSQEGHCEMVRQGKGLCTGSVRGRQARSQPPPSWPCAACVQGS